MKISSVKARLRNAVQTTLSKLSDKLYYHRFIDKPWTFLESNMGMKIDKEVKKLRATLLAFAAKNPVSFEGSQFNKYGAFICRDLINKEIFDITEYADSDIYEKAKKISLRTNFSPEVEKLCAALREDLQASSSLWQEDSFWSVWVKENIYLLLLGYFAHRDTKSFANNCCYAFCGVLVASREGYDQMEAAEAKTIVSDLNEFLFEMLNDSMHIYSYNMYGKLHRNLPEAFSVRMPTVDFKFRQIQKNNYVYSPKRTLTSIQVFNVRSKE